MAKTVGIDVKIDLPSKSKLEADLKKKWSGMKNDIDLKINVQADKNSLAKMGSQINNYFKGREFGVDIKVDLKNGQKKLQEFTNLYKDFRKEFEKGLEMKFNPNKTLDKSFQELVSGKSQKLHESQQKNGDYIKALMKDSGSMSKVTQQTIKEQIKTADDALHNLEKVTTQVNAFKKEVKSSVDGEVVKTDTYTDKIAGIKAVIDYTKEVGRLERDNLTASKEVVAANNKIIELNKRAINGLKQDYKNTFGEDITKNMEVAKAEASAQSNIAIQKALIQKEQQAAVDKQRQATLNEVVKLENEIYGLAKKQQNAGSEESSVYDKQIAKVREKSNALKMQTGIMKNLTKEQRAAYDSLRADNKSTLDFNKSLMNAKSADKARVNAQKAALQDMKRDLKEIQKLEQKADDIRAKKTVGGATVKENDNLRMLESELAVRKKIYDQELKSHNKKGNITKSGDAELKSLEKKYDATKKITQARASEEASIRKEQNAFKALEASIKKVSSLKKDLGKAGNKESSYINEVIKGEEAKQAAIEKSITAQKKFNKAKLEEVQATRKASYEEAEQSATRSQLSGQDSKQGKKKFNSVVNIDPIRVAQTAKRAFMTVYDSLAKVDEQVVNIQKVADVPAKVLNDFNAGLYDQAAEVGKSADAYAESVARWLTTGKTLSESNDLAKISVMGSFVGNIDEEDMVNYMAVPLNAYKDSALEATDVINAMNEVSNNNAIEMEHLGAAYSRAASTATTAGTSFAQLTGMITAGQESTRAGGEKLGTALRAIDINFGKMSSGMTKADKERSAWFASKGVALKDENNELRSTYDILNDLSSKWGELDGDDRTTATTYAAGKNHAAILQGIVKNWDAAQKATAEAQGQIDLANKESGSAFKEFESQQDSIQYKTAQLTAEWQKFLHTIAGGREGVNGVLGILTDGLAKANELASNDQFMGFVKNALKLGGAYLGLKMVNKGFGAIGDTMGGVVGNLSVISGIIGGGKGGKLLGAFSKGGGKMFGGMATGLGSVIGLFGKFIPFLNIALIGMTALQMAGVDVFGGIGRAINDMGGSMAKTKRKVSEYRKEQEKLNEVVKDGLDSARTYKKVEDTRTSLDKTVKDKRKKLEEETKLAEQEGRDKPVQRINFTEGEFEGYKKQIEDLAGEYGLDIKVDSNNIDEILEKMAEVERSAKRINAEKGKELNKAVKKSTKYTGNDILSELDGKHELPIGAAEEQKKIIQGWSQAINEGTMTYGEMAKNVTQMMRQNLFTPDQQKWMSPEAAKVAEENTKRMNDLLSQRSDLVASAKDNVLPPTLNKESVRLMATELRSIDTRKTALEGVNKVIKDGGVLSKEQHELIKTLDPGGKFLSISNDTAAWGENTENVKKALSGLNEELNKTSGAVENNVRKYAKESLGYNEDEINNLVNNMRGAKAAYVAELATWGDEGKSILGVTQRFAEETGNLWGQVLTDMQADIDNLSSEDKDLAIKFNLVKDDGFLNIEELDNFYNLPDSIAKEFNLVVEGTGEVNIEKALDFSEKLAAIDDADLFKKIDIQVDGMSDGVLTVDELVKNLDKLDAKEMMSLMMKLDVDETDALGVIQEITGMELNPKVVGDTSGMKNEIISAAESTEATAKVNAELDSRSTSGLSSQINAAMLDTSVKIPVEPEAKFTPFDLASKLNIGNTPPVKVPVGVDGDQAASELQGVVGVMKSSAGKVEVVVTADGQTAESTLANIGKQAVTVDESDPNVLIMADGSKFYTVASDVQTQVSTLDGKVVSITFKGVEDASLTSLKALAASGVTVKGKGSKSIAASIGQSIASSFSTGAQAVGQAVEGANKSMSKGSGSKGNPRYANDKISQDVWRYWSKELFNGLPIENSMEKLKHSIDAAKDNEIKLISLYKQQISLTQQQIRHNEDMKRAKQDEMNAILSDLRKQGFKTSGNKVTNLGHAKSIKGEDAVTLANENLNKYKDLYNQINDLNSKILSLQHDKTKINDDIKSAEKSKEAKALDGRFKRTDALLTAIKNNTDISNKKISLIDDADFELKLTMNEEGLNMSKNSISLLTDEFNSLSKMYVKHDENAENVKGKLEDLKTEILNNADAIIEYNSRIKDIQMDRLNSDLDKFSSIMERNLGKVKSNIENLKEGLMSDTSFGDLGTASFDKLDLSRKTKLEKQFEERLALEARLNEALDGYSKKNIDRTAKVSNQILTIEKNKYDQLLKMQSDFSNGKVSKVNSIKPSDVLGKTSAEKDGSYTAWTKSLEKVNNDYTKAYSQMSKRYDEAIKNAKTQAEKDSITHGFIVEQLKLQEDMYRKIIQVNKEAVEQANEMLNDTGLTTSQRESLEGSLADYQDAITEAQNSIKEAVKSRYELEFDLMDKLAEKASNYTEEIEYLLSIQEAISKDNSGKTGLLEAIYESKINEYGSARSSLAKLLEEQKKVGEGSYEWKILQDRIDDVRGSLKDLTVDILEANKDLMENRLDVLQDDIAKGMFDGKTLKQWENFKDKWVTGIEKELELDKVRRRAIDLESDLYDKKLEALDRQEAVSKKDLEYLDKQLTVLELQEKLDNLNNERDVQTLVRNDDGTWDWQYVANQTEIDKVKEDLEKAELDLIDFKNDQRKDYFKDLSDILDQARDGEFSSEDDLMNALNDLKKAYGFVLDDIPGIDTGDFDEILRIYGEYLNSNKDIISGMGDGEISKEYEALVDKVGLRFEEGFRNIADELGNIISESLKSALQSAVVSEGSGSYLIERQILEFPNVKDTDGFREVLETLPAATKQKIHGKE